MSGQEGSSSLPSSSQQPSTSTGGSSHQDVVDVDDDDECQIPGFASITQFSSEGIRKILTATRAFQSLPSAGPAWDLQKSYPAFNRAMKNARSKIVPMITLLLKHANISADEFRFGDMDEKFDFLVEANDDMLERIGRALDEASGLFKKADTIVVNHGIAASSLRPPGTWGKRKAAVEQSGPSTSNNDDDDDDCKMVDEQVESKPTIRNNREIKRAVYKRTVKEKPQVKFKTPVDNSPSPFVPKLKEKPNSIKPLSILPEYNSKNEEFYGHPYFVELNQFEPQDTMLVKTLPKQPKSLESTPLVEINTVRDIEQLLRDLYPVTELAVDLEHHGYRSFLGFTCLIQISTRDKDYIIDALALRDHLYHLNEIFTNPKIVKVLHGSSSDIEWLQKDFGLYIVNMFDTQVAAKLLGFQQLGLQFLLDKYCGVTQNKTFQLADWRIRPLLKEMIHYARQDTHSLLYVYDMMRNELIDAGNDRNHLLMALFEQSKMQCLKRYEKPGNNPKLALRKMRRSLNNRQIYAFMELYKWRDGIARDKDESINYVLPNHMLLMISEQLPKEMTGILACCDPVPPLVQSSLGTMHKIITSARELPLQEHSNEEKSDKRQKLKDWVILMNSVHDVNPEDISQSKDESDERTTGEANEEYSTEDDQEMEHNNDVVHFQQQHTLEWPQPLKEPGFLESSILFNPSILFNTKMKSSSKSCKSSTTKKAVVNNNNDYSMEAAATPFDRYQLSKEIMELLSNPAKKEILDMENPVVKAIYETVFCDPTDLGKSDKNQTGPQELEKVFTEGEFIPFNPLINGTSSGGGKKRKRTEHTKDTWNDGEPKTKDLKMSIDSEEDSSADDDSKSATTTMDNFMPVSTNKDEKNKKNKRKNKGNSNNLLNKLKNTFSRGSNRRDKKESGNVPDVHDGSSTSHNNNRNSPRKNERNNRGQQQQGGSRSSPRNRSSNTSISSQSPRQGNRNNKNNRGGKKGGGKGGKFFNFQKRGGGEKSMTFK